MTTALTIAGVIVAIYVAILGLLWRMQERIVFQPPTDPGSPDSGTGTIAYSNRSPDTLRVVYVQLLQNIFAPNALHNTNVPWSVIHG